MNDEKRGNDLQKLVSNARAIISYQVGLPVGCTRMRKIFFWLKSSGGIMPEIPVFDAYSKATNHLPTGTERLHCSREALRRYDQELIALNLEYREAVIDACFEVIERYGGKEA